MKRGDFVDRAIESYERFLNGDNSGLEAVVREYKDGLIMYLNGFVRNINIAEELTEEAFVKLVLKRPRFSKNASFKTWLYTIARNVAIDYLRHNKKEVCIEDYSYISSEDIDLEKNYIQKQDKLLLYRTIDKLKPDHRQVLWLFYFEQLSNKEIAKIMGKTTHNVETLVHRARNTLKSKLLEEGFEYENL